MKTTIEVHGYEITIDEMNDRLLVSASKDGETVEEFELEFEEGFEDDKGMKGFGEEEEDDFDMDDDDMGDEDDDMGDEDDDMGDMEDMDEEETNKKLESFNHFVRRKR